MSLPERFSEPQFSAEPAADCAAFVSDAQTHAVVESVVHQFFDGVTVRDGGSQQALEYLSDSPTPRVIIVDIADSAAPLTAMLSLTAAFTEDTQLIGIGTVNDVNLYREIVGAGVADYLVKPVTEKSLAAALTRAQSPEAHMAPTAAEPASGEKANRIAVFGARGGAGASSLAVNLAWILAESMKQDTALIDLDLEYGTVALALDLEPTRGLREALESPARVDSLFIESATAKVSEHLSIMATEETLTDELMIHPDSIDVLFDFVGRSSDNIIVDIPRWCPHPTRQRAFSVADHILLVTELSLPGLRDSMRAVSEIGSAASGRQVTIVANRTSGSHQAMNLKDFQKALGHKVDYVIPEDSKGFIQAANNGKPIVKAFARSKASKAYAMIAAAVAMEEEEEDSKSARKKTKAAKSAKTSKKTQRPAKTKAKGKTGFGFKGLLKKG
jgi:pilus assembly protein CpaE